MQRTWVKMILLCSPQNSIGKSPYSENSLGVEAGKILFCSFAHLSD
jgi:hypothetical protein